MAHPCYFVMLYFKPVNGNVGEFDFGFFEKHQHIDWQISNFAVTLNIGIGKDDGLVKLIIFVLHYLRQRGMLLVILAAFYFNRQDITVMLNDKIKLAELFIIVIIAVISVGSQFLRRNMVVSSCCGVFC